MVKRRASTIHLALAYVTEALAIGTLVSWIIVRDVVTLIFFLAFVVITATFHVMYLISSLYEKVEELANRIEELVRRNG